MITLGHTQGELEVHGQVQSFKYPIIKPPSREPPALPAFLSPAGAPAPTCLALLLTGTYVRALLHETPTLPDTLIYAYCPLFLSPASLISLGWLLAQGTGKNLLVIFHNTTLSLSLSVPSCCQNLPELLYATPCLLHAAPLCQHVGAKNAVTLPPVLFLPSD